MQLELDQGIPVYVIDTSALLYLELHFKPDNPVFTAIWEEIEDMIIQGCFRTIDFVEDEINRYEGKENYLKGWVKKWKKRLVYQTDAPSYQAAIPIINEEVNTGFFDAKKQAEGIEEADPFLVAYCKVYGFTLITNESAIKPNKIPAVCQKNVVRCIDLNQFLIERGLRMERNR